MTTYLQRLGHLALPDGSLLRLDAECGRYVASRYVPGPGHLVLSAYTFGEFDAVVAVAAAWVDAYEASLAVGVRDGIGSGAAIPAPDQTNLGIARETA